MQRVVRTAVALSAALACSFAVAQTNTPQQKRVAQKAQAPATQPAGNAAAGATGEPGTVLSTTGGFGGLSTGALVGLGAVTLGAVAIASQNDNTPPATGTQ